MTLKKMVDGVEMDMTPEEEQQTLAEWAADAAARLPRTRTRGQAMIDAKAGEVRQRYITCVPGQEETYRLKERHAESYRAASYLGGVPAMVQAEADVTRSTPREACDAILAARDAWLVKAVQIERARRDGAVRLAACATPSEVYDVRDAAIAALDAL